MVDGGLKELPHRRIDAHLSAAGMRLYDSAQGFGGALPLPLLQRAPELLQGEYRWILEYLRPILQHLGSDESNAFTECGDDFTQLLPYP